MNFEFISIDHRHNVITCCRAGHTDYLDSSIRNGALHKDVRIKFGYITKIGLFCS